jgi:anti-sigma factor (TIGR02949 family)
VSCELSETRLHAYLDGELDAAGAAEFERHLEACPDCETRLTAETRLHDALVQGQLYERAPASLRKKIQSSLPNREAAPFSILSSGAWRWLALVAAVLLLAAVLGWRRLENPNDHSQQSAFAAAVVDAHLRSIQPGHLADVVSTDQHTVKPWFDGRLSFAPPVRDFPEDGFPLIGGRIDIINGHTVAALVYGRRKHVVNVFVANTQSDELWSGSGELQGYHWLAWQNAGFSFCAVSDVASSDLNQLKHFLIQ